MKNVRNLFSIVSLLLPALVLTGQNLTFSPEHPQPGEEVTIQYSPTEFMKAAGQLEAVAYFLNEKEEEPTAQQIELTSIADIYQGEIKTPANAKAMFIVVQSEDQKIIDTNEEKGYGTLFYLTDGKTPVQGSLAAMGDAYYSRGYWILVKRDYEKALKYYKKEFAAYPTSSENKELDKRYWYAIHQGGTDEDKLSLDAHVIELSKKADVSESDLSFILNYHRGMKENEEEAAVWEQKILKKYPKGELALYQKRVKFNNEKDVEKKEVLYKELEKIFSEKEDKAQLENIAMTMARAYMNTDLEKFQQYLALSSDDMNKAGLYNSIAWGMSGESLDAQPTEVEKGKEFSYKSIQILEQALENSTATKPAHYTTKQWKKSLESRLGMYADTYALLLYHAGDYKEALKYQAIACEGDDFSSPEMNERYAAYYEKVKGAEATEELLAKLISQGKGTAKMKEQYKRVFVENNTIEEAAAKQLAMLEEQAREEMKKEIKKKMLDKDPIDFALVDLDGKKVALDDLKGKVVVVDFWATWCGPCKASFPGMQQAVDKYKDRSDVAFLFVDTWERVKEKEKNAADFIQENNYTFHVLMDNDNKMVTDFGVQGIPTKFVLDKNGRIRFESVGYSGSADGLVDEMSIMIELAGQPESIATATSAK